jgi:hypothetical protein
MMIGISTAMVKRIALTASGSGSLSRKNAKYYIQNTPEARFELEVTVKPNSEIRNQIFA